MSAAKYVKGKDLKPGDVVQLINETSLQVSENDPDQETITSSYGNKIKYSPNHTFKILTHEQTT